MNTVFYRNKLEQRAFINPGDTVKPVPGFPRVCISTFSKAVIDRFAALEQVETIAYLYTANGANPVYKITYAGTEFAFYLSPVGAPACVSVLEEVIAMGAEAFVFFGCCGILDDQKVGGRFIVPTAAVRDEGTSYHYLLPGDEIEPRQGDTEVLTECLIRCDLPYVTGKIWTTDAIYRETIELITQRKNQGCIGVDMEYSALLAAAGHRNVRLVQFFYGADSLDCEAWQPRDLTDYGLSSAEPHMALAMECGLLM